MKLKIKSLALVLLAILTSLVPTVTSTYAASTTYTATKVYAVALDCPYHFTLSIQDNKLVMSGNAPDPIDEGSIKVELIKPVNYTSATIGTDGVATITKNTGIDLTNWRVLKQLNPTIVKTLTHTINPTSGNIAPIITVIEPDGTAVLTYDKPSVPKVSLAGVADGIYTLRVGYSNDPAYDQLYCDEIIVVMQGGKASIQVLPAYTRYSRGMIYSGYSLDKWNVRPYIDDAGYDNWIRSR